MKWLLRNLLIAVLLCLAAGPAAAAQGGAGKRRAFLVRNDRYPGHQLTHARNDVRSLALALQAGDFEVTVGYDLDRTAFGVRLASFAATVAQSDIVFFYFVGHGLQVDEENYFLPADFRDEYVTALSTHAVSATDIKKALAKAASSGLRLR